MKTRWYVTPSIIVVIILLLTLPACAAGGVAVAVNNSTIMNIDNVQRVAIANPEIADVLVVSASEILIVGKSAGVTTLHVWSSAGRSSYEIEVGANNSLGVNDIQTILGYSNIKVSKVNKTVILEGTVNDQYQKSRAEKVAGAYGDKVVNLLEISNPMQVKIEVKVIEISKNKLDNLGLKFGNNLNAPGIFTFGQGQKNATSENDNAGVNDRVFGWARINGQLDALIQNGCAKILSQPNIVTVSGEKANILVGGEVPVPVNSNSNNQVSIEWKEYGIKLEIAPEVSAEGLITSKVKAEVSSIDYSNPNTMVELENSKRVIPALKTRKAETVLALPSGQTMVIGGLISSEDAKNVTKIPFLSELPILGKLFTSTSFTSGQTEVIIIMTPTLVNAYEQVPMTMGMKKFMAQNPWGEKANNEKKTDTNSN